MISIGIYVDTEEQFNLITKDLFNPIDVIKTYRQMGEKEIILRDGNYIKWVYPRESAMGNRFDEIYVNAKYKNTEAFNRYIGNSVRFEDDKIHYVEV